MVAVPLALMMILSQANLNAMKAQREAPAPVETRLRMVKSLLHPYEFEMVNGGNPTDPRCVFCGGRRLQYSNVLPRPDPQLSI
ncbi:hypothetical protein L596_027765 [Steinernema carpocapsae]|uniref:Uncharacterized protein n=1 Tax=Steinernema carpocapsae TaxID=34508 RepID=A0A4U5LWG0_STECR|nr:hypothetical protein L596_027765 [Steinernema carpocapsae]